MSNCKYFFFFSPKLLLHFGEKGSNMMQSHHSTSLSTVILSALRNLRRHHKCFLSGAFIQASKDMWPNSTSDTIECMLLELAKYLLWSNMDMFYVLFEANEIKLLFLNFPNLRIWQGHFVVQLLHSFLFFFFVCFFYTATASGCELNIPTCCKPAVVQVQGKGDNYVMCLWHWNSGCLKYVF